MMTPHLAAWALVAALAAAPSALAGQSNTTTPGGSHTQGVADGLGTENSSCVARYKTEHPNLKDRSTAAQQAYVQKCVRYDVKAENTGAEGAKRQGACVADYKKAHPALKDRSTAGQQAFVSQCLKTYQADRVPN